MTGLLDFVYPVEDQLSIVEDAITYATSITNNIIYRTDLNSPYRLLLEAQVFVYNKYLERLADVNYELNLLFFRILGFEAEAERFSKTVLKFELINTYTDTKYFRQGFPVRSNNGIIYVTEMALAISAGARVGYVDAVATTSGIEGNTPELTINQPLQQIDVPFSVTNELPSTEGRSAETMRGLEIRVAQFIRRNGLITAEDYILFVRDSFPNTVVTVVSTAPSEIDVCVCYSDGTPLSATDFRNLQTLLTNNKMLGISRLRLNAISTIDLYVEVIGSIVTVSDAQTIADSINLAIKTYLIPSNPRQGEGNTKGIIIVNEIERQLAQTNIDYVHTVRLGEDVETAYNQNYVFNPITERVRLGSMKVVLIKDDFTGEYTY